MPFLAFVAGVLSALFGCIVGIIPGRLFTADRYSDMDARRPPPPVSLVYDIVASSSMGLGTGVAVMLLNRLMSSHYQGSAIYVGGFVGLFFLVKCSLNRFRSLLVAALVFGLVVGCLDRLGW
jgi:cytochrome c biogenesis protein CcdA